MTGGRSFYCGRSFADWCALHTTADSALLIVASAVVAAVCLAAVAFVISRARIRAGRRRPAESRAPLPPIAPADAALASRVEEARRELAAQNEQLTFVRELLQTRTRETERLVDERVTVLSRLTEARADAERWEAEHARVAAVLQAERVRFASEVSRLSDELLRGSLDVNRRVDDLIEVQRELTRRKEEIETLRTEAMNLRAELTGFPQAVNAPTPIAPPGPRRWRPR